ncbi:M48 family metallopeptidase [Kutzneria sp. NPDC052558]|uniref:M48 family metallopeptidase n=1 Tax=Kutzneria sp. NPDC052558 TaxID=3364121 RepID=UPI0037C97C9E
MSVEAPAECPQCAGPLVSEQSTIVWCAGCDWNLDAYDAERTGLLARWNHRTAFRLNREMFGALAGDVPRSRGWSTARVVLLTASALLFAVTVGLAVGGIWLISFNFPNFATLLLGLVLLALAALLRPRLHRFTDTYDAVSREEAPALFALVERVAAAIGAPAPSIIVVNGDFNASAGTYGLRRRTVLRLGLPLWGVLGPQQRIALLGHELGHFVNGDPTHALLTQQAFRTLGQVAAVLAPEGLRMRRPGERLAQLIVWPLFWLASRTAAAGQMVLLWVGMREHQRAEYAADAAAARVAGTEATVRLLDDLVIGSSLELAIRTTELNARAHRGGLAGVTAWQSAAARVRADLADRIPVLRQRTIRSDANLAESHPPAGYRARIVESWPATPAGIELDAADSARVDAELAKRYTRVGRDIVQA